MKMLDESGFEIEDDLMETYDEIEQFEPDFTPSPEDYTDVKNPEWGDEAHSCIVVDVLFAGDKEYCRFVASDKDCTSYGPKIFKEVIEGKYGEVQDSAHERMLRGDLPLEKGMAIKNGKLINVMAIEQQAQQELNAKLETLLCPEAKALAELNPLYAKERKVMLESLLAVKHQDTWPFTETVTWPNMEPLQSLASVVSETLSMKQVEMETIGKKELNTIE